MDKKILEYEAGDSIVFEFNNLDYIEDFELFENILIKDINAKIIEKFEGPSSKVVIFNNDGLKFKLINNSDLGNSLILINHSEKDNSILRQLAFQVYDIYVKKYPENINEC